VLTGRPVVGVEVADDEAATVEEHHHRRSGVIGWRPVDPDVYRPGRPVDGAVFHPKLGIEAAPRQLSQRAAGRVDPFVGG
jgi:hypothetical protein